MKINRNKLTAIYDQWSARLYQTVLRLVKNPSDAEDIVQKTFLEALIKSGQLCDPDRVSFWLSRIAINKALNSLRTQNSRFLINVDHYTETADLSEEEDWLATEPQHIVNEINNLPDGYGVVLNLYVFEDLSYNDIAQILGITASTSRSQYWRALQLLRKQLIIQQNHG